MLKVKLNIHILASSSNFFQHTSYHAREVGVWLTRFHEKLLCLRYIIKVVLKTALIPNTTSCGYRPILPIDISETDNNFKSMTIISSL